MSMLAMLIICHALSNAGGSSRATSEATDGRGARAFTFHLYSAGGSAVSAHTNGAQRGDRLANKWLQLRPIGDQGATGDGNDHSRGYWLLLAPKQRDYLPILITSGDWRVGQANRTHTQQSPDCLYSAASHLIPYPRQFPLVAHGQRTHKQLIRRLIRSLSALSSAFQPTDFLTVSLCDGIRGIVALHNSTLYVHLHSKPHSNIVYLQESSSAFAHEKLANLNPLEQSLTRLAERTASRRKRSKRSSFEMPVAQNMSGPWLVELYIIVDASIERLNTYNNYYQLVSRIINVINHVNMAFGQFNIYFTVVQLEIWKHDQITLTDENHIIMELQLYKRRFITKRHDCLHAILGGDLGSSRRGQAEPASMCGYNNCVGYTKNYSDPNDVELSHSVLHELGHNFGLHHDTEQCHCFDCIMSTGVQFRSTMFRWSSCSKKEIISLLRSGMTECLRDRPASDLAELHPVIMEPHNVVSALEVRSTAMCGNGVVDAGEQCDCGDNKLCECCEWRTCRFKRGARCAGGSCCDLSTCSFKRYSHVCRPVAQDSCDLPEYCNGLTEWCPADLWKQDGTACTTNAYRDSSLCYRGRCETRYSRCQMLWGETASEASQYCFEMNTNGDLVKNCGVEIPRQVDRERQPRNWNPIRCSNQDATCGRLWCSHNNERVLSSSANTAVDEMVNGYHCSAVRFDMDWFLDELGMVPNGATCGSGKVCWKSSCVRISSIKFGDCFCHGHGVCNNMGHCHCDPGFAPPNCTSLGNGGSIDSGPPVPFHSRFRMITASIIISLIVILTALVIVAFIYHYRNHTWPWILSTIKCPRYGIVPSSLRACYKRHRKPTIDAKNTNESCVTLLSDLRASASESPKPELCKDEEEPVPDVVILDGSLSRKSLPRHYPSNQDTITANSQYSKFQKPLTLNIDVKRDIDQNFHRSPVYSPNSSEKLFGQSLLSPTAPVKQVPGKPLSVRDKAKFLEHIGNSPSQKPLVAKPNAKPAVQVHAKPSATAVTNANTREVKNPPKITHQKPTPSGAPLAEKPPPILIGKPQKPTKAQEAHKPEPVSQPPPPVSNVKPVKAAESRDIRHPPKPVSSPNAPMNHAAPPPKTEARPNQKKTDLEAKTATSKMLRDALEKGKRPPISASDKPQKPRPISGASNSTNKPDKPNSSAGNSTNKPDKPSVTKPVIKPSQSFAQVEISKPKLEHTSNSQPVVAAGVVSPPSGSSRPTAVVDKRPPILTAKPSAKAPVKSPVSPADNEKPGKPMDCAKDGKDTKDPKDPVKKPSKYQISQPRLEQTTCTDATRDLPATDKTLTRNIAPHRILKCEPDKAVKYL